MVKLKIRHGIGGGSAIMPAGLILGVAPGVLQPAEWSVWSAANNFFLKGTDSDALINTTVGRTSISGITSSGGSHSNANVWMGNKGSSSGTRGTQPDSQAGSVGSHSHSLNVGYKPPLCSLKLVQAQQDTPLFAGAIFFSAVEKPEHQYYSDNVGILGAGLITETVPQEVSASIGSGNDSHSHVSSTDRPAEGVTLGAPTSMSSGGGNHSHSWSPAITLSIKRALMRIYQVVDLAAVDDMVGIWNQAGVPDGWEVVAELIDGFLEFSNDASGDGSVSGDNTILVSGNTGSSGHSHSASGDSGTTEAASVGHTSTINHTHNVNRNQAYEPEHYYVKFIRKLP